MVTAAVVTRVEARMIVAMHMIVEETLETARVTLNPLPKPTLFLITF